MNHYMQRFKKKVNAPPIIFQVFDDRQKISVHDVIEETEKYYVCFSEWTGNIYNMRKDRVWRDRDALRFHRWAQRVHEKPSKVRYKFLDNTTNTLYKEKYIREFPEKLI